MRKLTKRVLITVGIAALSVVCLVGLGIGLSIYVTRPLDDGRALAEGNVTTVVTGHFGPVAIAAYLFDLGERGVGLVDAGSDPKAAAIHTALRRLGKTTADVGHCRVRGSWGPVCR